MVAEQREISFNGRVFDRRALFAPIAPTPRLIAERLAFPADYYHATKRLDRFIRDYNHRDFQGYGDLVWSRREAVDPVRQAQGLVATIDSFYDPENENTLERVAALVARHPTFLRRHGISGDEVIQGMLFTATEREIDRAKGRVKESHGASYYKENLRALRAIERGIKSLTPTQTS